MAAPVLPPRANARSVPNGRAANQGYPGGHGNPECPIDEDHYKFDGFDEGEFSDQEEDYEEPQDPRDQHPSFRDKAVPPLPPGRGGKAMVPGGPSRPGMRPVPPPVIPDDEGEEYTCIPDEPAQTRLFNRGTRQPSGRGPGRPLPPPPSQETGYPQEDYEVPNENHQEEEYTEPDEISPARRPPAPIPVMHAVPPRVDSRRPSFPTETEDVYEGEEPEQGIYEEDIGGQGEVYEEMENTGPPPVPTGMRPPMIPAGRGPQLPPPRNNPQTPSKAVVNPDQRMLNVNSVAVRAKRDNLKRVIPNFNNTPDTNNNAEEDVDPADLPLAQRMELLKAQGGMFASVALRPTPSGVKTGQAPVSGPQASSTPAWKKQTNSPASSSPPKSVTPSWKTQTPSTPPKVSSWTANNSATPVAGGRPLPDTPRESALSNTSSNASDLSSTGLSGGSGGSANNSRPASESSNESGSGGGVIGGASPARRQLPDGVDAPSRRPLPQVPPEEELEGLYGYAWYFGDLSRELAQSKIRQAATPGAFLIRKSLKGGAANPYTLSVYYNHKVWMLHIRKRHDQKYALGSEKPHEACFSTIPELVEYHHHSQIVLATRDDVAGEVLLTSSPPNPNRR